MKTKVMTTMLVGVAMILTTPLVTLGKGKPETPGSGGGSAGDAAGALYGDLYVIERDGNGVPVTRPVEYNELDENGNPTGQTLTAYCNQPLANNCAKLPFWGECGLTPMPEGVLELPDCVFDPEANDPCEVYSTTEYFEFVNMLQTVSFGRESVGRSPASVLDSSYGEALKMINLTAKQCDDTPGEGPAIKLDPAGRIMLCLATETDPNTYAWKTIDAPLENLGMYRAVMTDGCLSPIDETVVGEGGATSTNTISLSGSARGFLDGAGLSHLKCGDILPEAKTKDDMLSAAVFLGAAADKTSPVTLDEIINMNTYLGVNPYTYVREGKIRTLTVTYFEFADSGGPGGWFAYNFGVDACVPGTSANLLVANGNIFQSQTIDVFGESPPGVDLRGDNGVALTVCRDGLPLGEVCDNPGINTVYGPEITDIGCGGANWFAQAAEDARKTIWYLHNYEVPELAY